MTHYVLGSNGLQKPQKYNLEVGKAYYFGASSDPDVIVITRKDTQYVYYVKLTSRYELTYTETRDQSVFVEDLVSRAMVVKAEQTENYKKINPAYVDNVLTYGDYSDYEFPQDYMTFEENIQYQNELARNYKAPRYIDPCDVAKLIRTELKNNFPGIKFTVKTDKYSGGSSIRVGWYDGPTTKEVESVVGHYHGASFDGMQDLKESHDSELNGEIVHYGNDYLFCERKYTKQALEEVAAYLYNKFGWNVKIIGDSRYDPYFDTNNTPYDYYSQVNRELYNYSFFKQEEQPTTTEETPIQDNDPITPEDNKKPVFIGEYKGHPVISLPIGDNEFTFGVNKAKAILEYLEEIKKFIENNG